MIFGSADWEGITMLRLRVYILMLIAPLVLLADLGFGQQFPGALYIDGSIALANARYRQLQSQNHIEWLQMLSAYSYHQDPSQWLSALKGQSVNNSVCYSAVLQVLEDIGQPYALSMVDAFGKPASGILRGATTWYGSYEECLNVTMRSTSVNISGQYCLASTSLQLAPGVAPLVLTAGTCFPDVCDVKDVAEILNIVGQQVPLSISVVGCQPTSRPVPDTAALGVIDLLSWIALVILLATAYDLYIRWRANTPTISSLSSPIISHSDAAAVERQESVARADTPGSNVSGSSVIRTSLDVNHYTPLVDENPVQVQQPPTGIRTMLMKCLLAFSVITNGSKLLNTKSTGDGMLSCVHGVRFFSMTWVILGHTFVLSLSYLSNILDVIEFTKDLAFAPILTGTLSVDSFFLLSGTLASYLLLRELDKRGGPLKLNWFGFYFHRLWRLSPPYFILMGFYITVLPFLGQGPLWPGKQLVPFCNETWWSNLLYVQNLVYPNKQCFGWAWYLAIDMQFYIVSPLFIIPLYCFGWKALLAPLLGVLTACLSTGIISYLKRIPADIAMNFDPALNGTDAFQDTYVAPWCRVGPYAIGIILGFLLYINYNRPIRLHKALVFVGWIVAAGFCFSVTYGLTLAKLPEGHTLSLSVNAFYAAMFRSVWAAGLAWLIFACVTGYGGWLNRFLSWSPLVVLSRLTYMAYLVHPMVMFWYWGSLQAPIHATYLTMTWQYFGFVVSSYGVAFIVSLTLESPMIGLERVLLRKQ